MLSISEIQSRITTKGNMAPSSDKVTEALYNPNKWIRCGKNGINYLKKFINSDGSEVLLFGDKSDDSKNGIILLT